MPNRSGLSTDLVSVPWADSLLDLVDGLSAMFALPKWAPDTANGTPTHHGLVLACFIVYITLEHVWGGGRSCDVELRRVRTFTLKNLR